MSESRPSGIMQGRWSVCVCVCVGGGGNDKLRAHSGEKNGHLQRENSKVEIHNLFRHCHIHVPSYNKNGYPHQGETVNNLAIEPSCIGVRVHGHF